MEDIIQVKNLVKVYNNGVKAVDDISFSIKKGSFVAFLGENGAGKSTTINILCTVLQKTSGKVYIDGLDIDTDVKKIRNKIGILFQNSVLDDNMTVKENIYTRAAYYGMSKKEIEERLEYLNIKFDLHEIMKRKYSQLSGGQKRKVDIVRCLIHKPKIIFLDEPTTGLDPKIRKIVWKTIMELKREEDLTIFLTTHYMEETLESDTIIVIDHGRIKVSDTPINLKDRYTSNKLVIYSKNNVILEKYLKDNSIAYLYEREKYIIEFTDYALINKIILDNTILNYEVIKGKMDDVFLNITGRRLEE